MKYEDAIKLSFSDCVRHKPGTIYFDGITSTSGPGKLFVLRGPMALCAYLGLPVNDPLVDEIGRDGDDNPNLNNEPGVKVHYGFTYSGLGVSFGIEGLGGLYLWGWDYSHCDDMSMLPANFTFGRPGKPWTPSLVLEDSLPALEQFNALCARLVAARPPPRLPVPIKPFGINSRKLMI